MEEKRSATGYCEHCLNDAAAYLSEIILKLAYNVSSGMFSLYPLAEIILFTTQSALTTLPRKHVEQITFAAGYREHGLNNATLGLSDG